MRASRVVLIDAPVVALQRGMGTRTAGPRRRRRRRRTLLRLPPIVCGDFNARPESTEVRFIKGLHALDQRSFHLFDAFEVANPGQPGYTWSNANPFAAAEQVPDQRIDYIFVGVHAEDGAGRVLTAHVVCNEPRGGGWPSDHFGVAAELSLAGSGDGRAAQAV